VENFSQTINNAFFFVIDKIIDMQDYFITQAKFIGRIVFLIAILSAALNYALTGTGLKENLIKIFKATVFFMIIISVYPRIIGWITEQTFKFAEGSIYESVEDYFNIKIDHIKEREIIQYGARARWKISTTITEVSHDESIFSDLIIKRNNSNTPHTVIAPANLFKIIFFIARDCIGYADLKQNVIPEFSTVLKGLICAFFIIITGAFAILEYIICFLEFMLVASVGVILFPLSIWEGSKFMSEKFIGALVGFFMKMLFCNIAIFLMLYGFVSMYYTLQIIPLGFTASVDQIIFIVFNCLLFYFICKSAPGIAQSLLTGTPTLSASGAISAATGAVAAAGATMGLAKKVGSTVVGGTAKGGLSLIGANHEANAAKTAAMHEVAEAGGSLEQQKAAGGQAYRSSFASSAEDTFKSGVYGLSRRLLSGSSGSSSGGGGTNPYSWRQDLLSNGDSFGVHFNKRSDEGSIRGKESAARFISNNPRLSANRERQKDPDYSASLDELNKEFPGTSNNDIK